MRDYANKEWLRDHKRAWVDVLVVLIFGTIFAALIVFGF